MKRQKFHSSLTPRSQLERSRSVLEKVMLMLLLKNHWVKGNFAYYTVIQQTVKWLLARFWGINIWIRVLSYKYKLYLRLLWLLLIKCSFHIFDLVEPVQLFLLLYSKTACAHYSIKFRSKSPKFWVKSRIFAQKVL